MQPFTKKWAAEAWAMSGQAASVTATMLAQLALSTIEIFFAARLGTTALAGITLASNIYFPVFLLALGVVTAVTPIAAQARGRGDEDGVRLAGQQALWISLFVSVPAMLLILAGALLLMRTPISRKPSQQPPT